VEECREVDREVVVNEKRNECKTEVVQDCRCRFSGINVVAKNRTCKKISLMEHNLESCGISNP
jgi:hypothetical protein